MTMYNSNDVQMIHAYLDDELTPYEKSCFEIRLEEDESLQMALNEEKQFREGFQSKVKLVRAPISLRRMVQLNLQRRASFWQRAYAWWTQPRAIRPSVIMLSCVVWSAVLILVVTQLNYYKFRSDALAEIISKHELYFEGKPSLALEGNIGQVNEWMHKQISYAAKIPDLGSDWMVTGARLDDFQKKPMVNILYVRENGQDASFSIFVASKDSFSPFNKITYGGQDYYVSDDGWHRTITWVSNDVGYAVVGNLNIPKEKLFNMAAIARSQYD